MARKHLSAWRLFVLVSSVLAACTAPTSDELQTKPTRVVEVQEVAERTWVEELDLTAEIQPWAAVTLAAEVAGRVSELPVDEGDRVKKGQVVARLDAADAEAQLAQAEARTASARASLNQAERDLERGHALASGDGLISEDELDRLELALDLGRANLLEAEAGLLVARERLSDTVLVAPFAGVIGERAAEVGSWVAPGQALMRVVDGDRVKVRGAAGQADRVGLEIGTRVQVRALALPDLQFEGAIRALGQEADSGTGTYRVEAEVPASHDRSSARLLPGMHAVMSVALDERREVVIPSSSIIGSGQETSVFVVEGQHARHRELVIEPVDTGEAAVLEGLTAGEILVVKGQHGLEDGAPVDVDNP